MIVSSIAVLIPSDPQCVTGLFANSCNLHQVARHRVECPGGMHHIHDESSAQQRHESGVGRVHNNHGVDVLRGLVLRSRPRRSMVQAVRRCDARSQDRCSASTLWSLPCLPPLTELLLASGFIFGFSLSFSSFSTPCPSLMCFFRSFWHWHPFKL